MVEIKTPEQIAKMREAGLVVAAIHSATREAAVPGATTNDLDQVARKVLAEHGAKPNFLGYGGFPATICTSVNEVVVHGIPDDRTVLKDGDIISIDCGAIIDGWHGDAAYTAFVGTGHAPELVELSRVTEESMWAGIAAMKKGARLAEVSKAIEGYIRRQPRPSSGKYGIIEDYGGHGIGSEMHMDPHLLNYVDKRRLIGRRQPEAGARVLPGDRADGLAGHPADPGAGRRLDGHHDRRDLVLALGALDRADRGGPDRADRARRRQGQAGRAGCHDRPRPARLSLRPTGLRILTAGHPSRIRLYGCPDVD